MPQIRGYFEGMAEYFWQLADSMNRTICAYCGSHLNIEKEHIFPKSRGGATTIPACMKCNRNKSDNTPQEWFMRIKNSARHSDQQRWGNIVEFHAWRRNELSKLVRDIRDRG